MKLNIKLSSFFSDSTEFCLSCLIIVLIMSMIQKICFLLSKSLILFQILSDLHLEICEQYFFFEIPVLTLYLILADDIDCLMNYDDYLSFLRRQTKQFERIFLVLDNHEFFQIVLSVDRKSTRLNSSHTVISYAVFCL